MMRQAAARRGPLLAALLLTLGWAASLLVGGCTSDPASPLGAGLIDNRIDSTLVALEITNLEVYAGLRVDNADLKIPAQQSLHVGTAPDTRASFLVNFDFGSLINEEYPSEAFDADNIKTVKLSLTKLLPYEARRDSAGVSPSTGLDTIYRVPTGQPLELYYFVHELVGPFDPLAFENYPTAVPPFRAPILTPDFITPNTSSEPSLSLYVDDFVRWVNAGVKVGILVQLGELSDPGLVGFASADLKTYSQVPTVAVGTIVGPNLIVDFEDRAVNLLVPPTEDTTVFEQLSDVPSDVAAVADGFLLRTGLRSYPALRFNLDNLPRNALINRAVLSVVNDTSRSFGPAVTLMVSEITAGVMDEASGVVALSTIKDASQVYPLSLKTSLRVKQDYAIEFDVTTGIRRAVNGVNDEARGFLLSGVEKRGTVLQGVPAPDPTLPDFYFREMRFFGLNDADPAARPKLKIWYSVVDELAGGGQ